MTDAQTEWLRKNPGYVLVGPPRSGVKFDKAGTLYADGSFDLLAPMKPIRLEQGCKLVGIDVTQSMER